jgi:hypothetical protein
MYLLDKLPPYEFNNNIEHNKNEQNIKKPKNECIQVMFALSFFGIISFAIYNIICILNVQIEFNKLLNYNKINIQQISYNSTIFLLIFDMILNMMYYIFTNILIHKNITGARYYIGSCVMCIIIIISILLYTHNIILNKTADYLHSIVMLDSAEYYHLTKHIRISTGLYICSYLINIISVIYLF